MYNKLPANKMNKQKDKEKETHKLTDNKDDRRIHRKVCICDNKKKHKYSPTTIISTKNPATQITYKKTYTNIKKDTDTDTNTNTNTDKTQRQREKKSQTKTSWTRAIDELTKL